MSAGQDSHRKRKRVPGTSFDISPSNSPGENLAIALEMEEAALADLADALAEQAAVRAKNALKNK